MMEPQPDYIHPLLLLCQQLKACCMLQGGLLSNSKTCLVLQTDANSSIAAETVTFAGSPITLAYFRQDHEHVNCPHSNSPTQQQHGSVSPSGVIFTLFNLKMHSFLAAEVIHSAYYSH